MRVMLTGAAGTIGRGFRDEYAAHFRDAYDLRIGVHSAGFRDSRFDDVVRLEIESCASLTQALDGVDVAVHLAANPDWDTEDFKDELLGPNIVGSYNVFEAARLAGVRRIVYASSVHAIMGYPLDVQAHEDGAPRADTLYGATKVFGEALCSSYAYLYGMSCVAVRIGAYVPDDERQKVVESDNPQLLDIVISQRDMAQLLHRAITAPASVGFAVVSGLSNNRFKRMSIERARTLLGYAPEDDAFAWSQKVRFGPETKV
jgi:uronate dehydrogenase